MKAMRKRPALYMIGAAILMVVLAGCTVNVEFNTPTVRLLELQTDWRLPDGTSVVCQNRPTVIEYKFDINYRGSDPLVNLLDRWTATYTGQNLQNSSFNQDLTLLGSSRDTPTRTINVEDRTVTVTTLYSNTQLFPQGGASEFEPAAIIVVPRNIIPDPSNTGNATLDIKAWNPAGSSLARANFSRRIPVYGNCDLQ